jgi:transposase
LELAETLNMDRRHLDRDTRSTLAKSLREQGHSLRAIAGALGVGKSQVARDLDEDGLPLSPDGTVASEPSTDTVTVGDKATSFPAERVVGMDGRSQPATRRGPWSPDELLSLLDRLDSGESRDELATEYGISRSNLGSLLTRARKLRKGETQIDKLARLSENVRVEQITDAAAEGLSSHQIAAKLGIGFEQVRNIVNRNRLDIPADAVVGRSRKIDSARIADETAGTLEGVAASLRLIDTTELDPAHCADWATSISESLKVLTRFRNQLKEMARESE